MNQRFYFKIVWKDEDGKEILTNTITRTKKLEDRKTFDTISVLRLKPQIEDDQKKIFCTVSSDISPSPKSAMTLLRLKYKPRIKFSYKKEFLNEGDSFSATCNADAYPNHLEFSWYFDGQLMESERLNTLTIPKVTKNHLNSLVKCQAKNSVGISEAEGTINVKCEYFCIKLIFNVWLLKMPQTSSHTQRMPR